MCPDTYLEFSRGTGWTLFDLFMFFRFFLRSTLSYHTVHNITPIKELYHNASSTPFVWVNGDQRLISGSQICSSLASFVAGSLSWSVPALAWTSWWKWHLVPHFFMSCRRCDNRCMDLDTWRDAFSDSPVFAIKGHVKEDSCKSLVVKLNYRMIWSKWHTASQFKACWNWPCTLCNDMCQRSCLKYLKCRIVCFLPGMLWLFISLMLLFMWYTSAWCLHVFPSSYLFYWINRRSPIELSPNMHLH